LAVTDPAADPGFAKKGRGRKREREPKGESGAGPCGGSGGEAPLKLKKAESFCPFSYKKGPKAKDLNENLPPCLRHTVSRSHDEP